MKKILAAALALMLSAAIVTGCSDAGKPAPESTTPESTEQTASDSSTESASEPESTPAGDGTLEIKAVEDLNGLKIGVQAGTTGETYVKDSLTDAKVSSFKSGMDAALDLKNGNIDAIVLDELPSKSIVAQNDDLTIIDLNLEPEEYAIAVKKGNTELVEQINATLKKMKDDGSYDALTGAYMPADGNITVPEDKAAEGEGKLVMGTNAAFAPFEYLEGTKIVGFDISLSQAIAADQGKQLEVSNMDFDALIPALTAGQIDFIAAGMSVTPERLENVDFTDTYYASKQVVIVKK